MVNIWAWRMTNQGYSTETAGNVVHDLSRLFRAQSIAVIGGGSWCASIIGAARRIGYRGQIFPVHPNGKKIAGIQALKRLEDWSGPIDAAFIGINRQATISAVSALRELGAGGAVCFASGFLEAQAELGDGGSLQAELLAAADAMPILGPNCYGFVNALDQVAIWPDQHGMAQVDSGVAILTQSSNIAINLTMQQRALPLAYMVTCGNMAQTDQAQIALSLLDDPRITAIGLHVEGFTNLRAWEALAQKAHARDIALVVLKVGKTDHAQAATISHTASLAGNYAGATALIQRLGAAQVEDIPTFLETLKLAHMGVGMPRGTISGISCSGGEASLIADMAKDTALRFVPLTESQKTELLATLGPKVALSNPLDYHTYIWRDTDAMARTFAGIAGPQTDLNILITDYPTADSADWSCATEAVIAAKERSGAKFAVAATLPELMPPGVAKTFAANGIVPICGLREGIQALDALTRQRTPESERLVLPGSQPAYTTLNEAEAKAELTTFGIVIPKSKTVSDKALLVATAREVGERVVLKGLGLAHKSEHGAVRLGLIPDEVQTAAQDMPADSFLIEEMIQDAVAELLIGVTRDPAHGFILTLAAGGVLTELMQDSASLLVPASANSVKAALHSLNCTPLLTGYRGQPAAHLPSIIDTIMALQRYVAAHADCLDEVEINPLLCTSQRAVAADALIRIAKDS